MPLRGNMTVPSNEWPFVRHPVTKHIYFDFLNLLTRGDMKQSNIWKGGHLHTDSEVFRPKSTGNPINNRVLERCVQISGFSK